MQAAARNGKYCQAKCSVSIFSGACQTFISLKAKIMSMHQVHRLTNYQGNRRQVRKWHWGKNMRLKKLLACVFFFSVAGGQKEGALMIRLAPNAQGQRGKDEKADPSEGFRKWPAEEEAGRQTVLIKSVMSWGLGAKNAALLKNKLCSV